MNPNKFDNRLPFLASFAYLGTAFHGVQEQPQLPTVLGAVRRRIEESSQQKAHALFVTARTDRGVHALQNFVTFYLRPPLDVSAFIKSFCQPYDDGLYAVLVRPVEHRIHARGNARGKVYRYTIKDGCREALLEEQLLFWRIAPELCIEAMQRAASFIVGKRDFSSLRGGGCQAGSAVKEITDIKILRNRRGFVIIEILGNSFLRKMVRNTVGLLVEVGSGLRTPDSIPSILAKKSRLAAGITAPAHGLCLVKIEFIL